MSQQSRVAAVPSFLQVPTALPQEGSGVLYLQQREESSARALVPQLNVLVSLPLVGAKEGRLWQWETENVKKQMLFFSSSLPFCSAEQSAYICEGRVGICYSYAGLVLT